jgi:hypothetical protein
MQGNGSTPSLRQRLATRERPSLPFRLLVDDPSEAVAALEQAQAIRRQVVIRDEPDLLELEQADAAVQAAQEAVDGCYVTVVLRALRPADYEALQAAHPPTAEQAMKDPPEIWNPDTFRPALLAACAAGDMTEADWANFLEEHTSQGERQGLYVAALAVNERVRAADPLVLPKG